MRGQEEDSNDVFLNWLPDKSLSFAGNAAVMNESWLEIGESKLKISASKSGQKDTTGKKYSLVAYCIPVSEVISY